MCKGHFSLSGAIHSRRVVGGRSKQDQVHAAEAEAAQRKVVLGSEPVHFQALDDLCDVQGEKGQVLEWGGGVNVSLLTGPGNASTQSKKKRKIKQ